MEERRSNSLETILLSLGKLEQGTTDIKETVVALKDRVGIQNGRVGKLERWQAFTQGAVGVLIILVVPVVVKIVAEWFIK